MFIKIKMLLPQEIIENILYLSDDITLKNYINTCHTICLSKSFWKNKIQTTFIPNINYTVDEYHKLNKAKMEIDRIHKILKVNEETDILIKIPCNNKGENEYVNKLLTSLNWDPIQNVLGIEFRFDLSICWVEMYVVSKNYKKIKREDHILNPEKIKNIFYTIFYYYPYTDIKCGLYGQEISLFGHHLQKYKDVYDKKYYKMCYLICISKNPKLFTLCKDWRDISKYVKPMPGDDNYNYIEIMKMIVKYSTIQ